MAETREEKWDRISKEFPILSRELTESGWTRDVNPLDTLVQTTISPTEYWEKYHWPRVYGPMMDKAIDYADRENDIFRNLAYSDDFALKKHPSTGELIRASSIEWNTPTGKTMEAVPFEKIVPTLEGLRKVGDDEYLRLVDDFVNSDKPVGMEHLRGVFAPMTYRKGRANVWSNTEPGQSPWAYEDYPGVFTGKPAKTELELGNPQVNESIPAYWFSQDILEKRPNPSDTRWGGFYQHSKVPRQRRVGDRVEQIPGAYTHPFGPKIALDYTSGPGALSYYHEWDEKNGNPDLSTARGSRQKLLHAMAGDPYPKNVTYSMPWNEMTKPAFKHFSGSIEPGEMKHSDRRPKGPGNYKTLTPFMEKALKEEMHHFMTDSMRQSDILHGVYQGPDRGMHEGTDVINIPAKERGQLVAPGIPEYNRQNPAAMAYSYAVHDAFRNVPDHDFYIGRWEKPEEADIMISDMIEALATRHKSTKALKEQLPKGTLVPANYFSGEFHKKANLNYDPSSETGLGMRNTWEQFGDIIKEHEEKTGRPYRNWDSRMWQRIQDSSEDPQGLFHYIMERAPMLLGEKKRNLNEAMV